MLALHHSYMVVKLDSKLEEKAKPLASAETMLEAGLLLLVEAC